MNEVRRADAVVVGGGVIGAAIAHSLAGRGIGKVILLDQGRAGGQGATSRSGGLLRLHHTAECDIRLAARARPVFEHWGDVIGGDCGFRETGFVMLVDDARAEALRANWAATVAVAGARSAELLAPAEAGALYPGLITAGAGGAVYEPGGGYADPVAATTALIDAARRRGVLVAEGVRAERVTTAGEAVTGIGTTIGHIAAPAVVLAGGAWGAAPAARLGLSLPVTARRIGLALAWLPGAGRRGTATALPTCIDDTTGCYFRPDGTDRLFYGVPCDPAVEPGRDVPPLRSPEVTAAGERLARRVRGAATLPVIGTRAGFDGYTPDKHPIIGPAGPDGLYLALGFSGGGFKIAPAVAELAAAEIAGEGRHSLLQPYRPQRFAERELVTTSTAYDHM